MKILYVAAGIPVPGSIGGSTHVLEVCQGLAALGYQVLAITGPAEQGVAPLPLPEAIEIVNMPQSQALGLTLLPTIERLIQQFRPAAIMERYYNLAGAGIIAARRHRLPSILEVNAPVYDPPGSRKDRLDHLLGQPLRRWARWQVQTADRIVTPLATTVGALARPGSIVELPWGANTALFDPASLPPATLAATRNEYGLPAPEEGQIVAFSGSFRHWHGVESLLAALQRLLPTRPKLWALLIGDGAERAALMQQVSSWGEIGRRIIFTGRLPYMEVPRHLAVATLGVAPFEPARHDALRHFGFYWSPLKIFEYGAMGLPTVCPAIPPLDTIVRDGQEGRLYQAGDIAGLMATIAALLDDPTACRTLGQAARARVNAEWSWATHCRSLDKILQCLTH